MPRGNNSWARDAVPSPIADLEKEYGNEKPEVAISYEI